MRNGITGIFILAGLPLAPSASAASATGAAIVRLADGATSRCISSSSDQVWLSMRRIILNKEHRLFSVDKYAGVVVNTTISGDSGPTAQKIGFPRMIEADIESYESGHGVSVPVEFGLLQGFRLRSGTVTYTNVDFDFNVIKGKTKTSWGQALNALVGITKKLPMPTNPFSEGFQYFADYANSVVDASVQERKSDNLRQGVVHLSFSPNGQCSGSTFESTGTIAVIFATPGNESEGYADIARINNDEYCWDSQFRPTFSVKFGKKSATGPCTATTTIRNDYYGFFLNAVPVSIGGAPSLREDWNAGSWGHYRSYPDATAKKMVAGVKLGNAEVEQKTAAALQWDSKQKGVPFGHLVAVTSDNGFVWRATAFESSAFDLAEALRRCAAHGVEPSECLPGVTVGSPALP
jgi:hypothetical protein